MDHAFSKNVSRKTYINSGIINDRKIQSVWTFLLKHISFEKDILLSFYVWWRIFEQILKSLQQSSDVSFTIKYRVYGLVQWISCFILLDLVSILSNLAFTVSNICFIACNYGDSDCIPFLSRIIDKMLPIALRKGAIEDAMDFIAFRKLLATRFSPNDLAVFSPVWTEILTAGENTCTCTLLYAS